jgi:hypothetical protein
MPRRQRFAVGFLFGLGMIVTVAGCVRTWFIYRSLFGEYDQTWYAYPLWIAAAVEIDLGVVSSFNRTPTGHTDMDVRFAHRHQYSSHYLQKYLSACLEHYRAAYRSEKHTRIHRQAPIVEHLTVHGMSTHPR